MVYILSTNWVRWNLDELHLSFFICGCQEVSRCLSTSYRYLPKYHIPMHIHTVPSQNIVCMRGRNGVAKVWSGSPHTYLNHILYSKACNIGQTPQSCVKLQWCWNMHVKHANHSRVTWKPKWCNMYGLTCGGWASSLWLLVTFTSSHQSTSVVKSWNDNLWTLLINCTRTFSIPSNGQGLFVELKEIWKCP